jgi:hypothetical protein
VCCGNGQRKGLRRAQGRQSNARSDLMQRRGTDWSGGRLHTEGSHPGLSDEDHSTFRLRVVLVMARTFLRRLHLGR